MSGNSRENDANEIEAYIASFHLFSLYFRNNEMGKGLPQDTKPTPFPRTAVPVMSEASAPSVNTLNKNCHELVNDEMSSYKSMTTLNVSDANGFSDDENENLEDFSNDPHQRLIF